jgi:hypothetical protein
LHRESKAHLGATVDKFTGFLTEIWTYKISLVPVLATYLLFDLPAIFRKITGVAYVPIYFIFFPSGHSDRLYAQYFNEDYMYGDGALMNDKEKKKLRHRIQATAIISMVFATVVAPWLCGFISAFYLTTNQFSEFLWFLIIVKATLIASVLYKLRGDSDAVRTGYSFYYVIVLYVAYLFLVWRGLAKAYEWTHTNLNSKGISGIAAGLLEYAYVDIFLNVVIVAAVTWGITTLFTSPSHIQRPYGEDEHATTS